MTDIEKTRETSLNRIIDSLRRDVTLLRGAVDLARIALAASGKFATSKRMQEALDDTDSLLTIPISHKSNNDIIRSQEEQIAKLELEVEEIRNSLDMHLRFSKDRS